MSHRSVETPSAGAPGRETPPAASTGWGALFRGRKGVLTAFIVLGTVLYSIQILVIVTVMPTVVEDIGGAAYYVWASMIYVVGTIVGAASIGPAWARLGARRLFLAAGAVFAVGTVGCALAPDMLWLVLARGVQGTGGGLVTGGAMGIVSRWFAAEERTRILAIYQGAWTVCSLLGPLYGGAFAEIGWWRGAFWSFVPIVLAYCAMAWAALPEDRAGAAARPTRAPVARLVLLALGVIGIAQAGQLEHALARLGVLALSIACTAWAFRIDAAAADKLFPSHPLSLTRAVGLGYWLLVIVGSVHAAVTVFLPLALQVVHGVTPLLVGMPALILSIAWTVATFMVSGWWGGARERFALISGPLFMLAGVAMTLAGVYAFSPALMLLACFVLGFGIGIHNVHLSARVMEHALPGEEAVTASSMSMVRPLGMAIGTAVAGMVANMAGLSAGLDPAVVNDAVAAVLLVSAPPLALATLLVARLARIVVPRAARGR